MTYRNVPRCVEIGLNNGSKDRTNNCADDHNTCEKRNNGGRTPLPPSLSLFHEVQRTPT